MTLAYVLIALLVGGGLIYPKWRARSRKPPSQVDKTDTNNAGAETAPADKKEKKPGFLSRVRGSMSPVTFFGILVFTAILIIFMLIPGDVVALIGTILMWALTALILTSIVMLVTGWGSRLVWLILLVGAIWLAYNPPATTAQRVAQGAETLVEKGLKGMAPSVTPLVPDIIYMTPEEKAAARKAEAAQRAIEAEAEKQRRIADAVAQAAAEAEAAKYRPLTTDAFTTRTAGKFEPILIKSGTRVGPIYTYSACKLQWTKKGMGMLKILTRHDPKKEPVEATLTDRGYGIKKTGHESEGPVADLFFEAVQGDVQIELVRFDNGKDLEQPCE